MAPNNREYRGARSCDALLSPWYQIAPRIGNGVNGAIIALYSPAGCHSSLSFDFQGNAGPGLPSAFADATAAFHSLSCFSWRTFTTALLSVIFAHSLNTG